MNIIFRTFEKDDDIKQIIKVHKIANSTNMVSSWVSEEFWKWKYHMGRPNYDPKGYQVAEYNNKLVSSINCTIREMNFGGKTYLAGGIDDVSTLPNFRRRGLSQQLLTNTIKFMEDKNVDLSILVADPSYHAHKFYNKNGFDYISSFKFAFKIINPINISKKMPVTIPIAAPVYLLQRGKEMIQSPKCKFPLEFTVIRQDNQEFLDCINRNYKYLLSFQEFSKEYWNWFKIKRPPKFESTILAVKLNGKIIGGGTLTKAYYRILNISKHLKFYVLSELFVDKKYRRQGVASKICRALEHFTSKKGIGIIIVNYNELHHPIENFLKKTMFEILKFFFFFSFMLKFPVIFL